MNEKATEELNRLPGHDARELKMYPFIKKQKSLQKAIEEFNRI